jgi:hypothetical protein
LRAIWQGQSRGYSEHEELARREAGSFVFTIRQGVTSRDVLFQSRIAEGAETDQRGAASPQAQEILCRSRMRPAGLEVSGIGNSPHAQGSISARHMLMMENSPTGISMQTACRN